MSLAHGCFFCMKVRILYGQYEMDKKWTECWSLWTECWKHVARTWAFFLHAYQTCFALFARHITGINLCTSLQEIRCSVGGWRSGTNVLASEKNMKNGKGWFLCATRFCLIWHELSILQLSRNFGSGEVFIILVNIHDMHTVAMWGTACHT
jgi:hypothetical protein